MVLHVALGCDEGDCYLFTIIGLCLKHLHSSDYFISFSSLTLQETLTKSGSYASLVESTDCFIKVYDLDPKALRGVCVCV